MNDFSSVFMSNLSGRLLIMIVYIVGILLALILWRRHAWVSLVTAAAFGWMLVVSIAMAVWYSLLTASLIMEWNLAPDEVHSWYTISGAVGSCLHAVGYGLLMLAIFMKRQPSTDRGLEIRVD